MECRSSSNVPSPACSVTLRNGENLLVILRWEGMSGGSGYPTVATVT